MVTVREYARLTTDACTPSLDVAQVPASAFDWLCSLQSRLAPCGATLLEFEGQRWLRLNSLVGVIQTPCGTTLEVLPKTFSDAEDVAHSRRLLRKMVAALLDLPGKEAETAALERFDLPLTEWVMAQFVRSLYQLVQQGIRSDYVRVEDELLFLRGQLNTTAQMRQPLTRAHLFHIRHDEFSPDQPANRLLRLALERVRKTTVQPETWRLANELTHRLADIPASTNPPQDWRGWGVGRLMARYQPIRPWCALVLGESMPLALSGETQGLSLLFPMEKLFESYVARWLRGRMTQGCTLSTQARSQWLAAHDGQDIFQLKPDLLVHHMETQTAWVLDTKWKRIAAHERDKNYGIASSDIYQMLAYGHTYLKGEGSLFVVYPAWSGFTKALPHFQLPGNLRLEAVPFDLGTDTLLSEAPLTFLRQQEPLLHSIDTDCGHILRRERLSQR